MQKNGFIPLHTVCNIHVQSCIKFTLCKIYPADHINVIKAYKASEHLAKYTQT